MGLIEPILDLLQRVPPAGLLVATDFDGTVSTIVSRPQEARPLPGVPEALASLRASVLRVAIITGRAESAVRALLPVEGLLVLGDYGRPDPTEAERQALRAFNRRALDLVAGRRGLRLEEKPGSTSIHYRDHPPAGEGLLEIVRPIAGELGLDAHGGRMVVEVLPGGWDKARALERLMKEERAAGAVYCGDDEGDRRCFELLAASPLPHLAVGVRSPEAAEDLFESCDLVLDGPAEAAAFLSRLASECERIREPGRADRGPEG